MSDSTFIILSEDIAEECDRQVKKWGIQSHPDGTGGIYKTFASAAKAETDAAFAKGKGSWLHILREEFYEAIAEDDPVRLREELVQVAAVCASWIRDIDSRASA